MSAYEVIVGTAGTIDKDGRALYHRLGDVVELTEAEAKRLLGLNAVAPAGSKPAEPEPEPEAKVEKVKGKE